jgi:hypothetical protein
MKKRIFQLQLSLAPTSELVGHCARSSSISSNWFRFVKTAFLALCFGALFRLSANQSDADAARIVTQFCVILPIMRTLSDNR